MIREVIIVEGKDDITRVREAVDAEVVATGGLHISPRRMEEICALARSRGAILLLDPDHAGDAIRRILRRKLKGCYKEAFLDRRDCRKNGDIGVENADPEAIRRAIAEARPAEAEGGDMFTPGFLFAHRLSGCPEAAVRREALARALHLGRPNAKEMVRRLNIFGYKYHDVERVLQEMDALDAPEGS